MLSLIVPCAFFLFFLLTAVFKIGYSKDKDSLLGLSDSIHIRGISAVVVILNHLPTAYASAPTRAAGMLAASGVTFFFLFSAYGLRMSMEDKPGYLRRFWLTRLPAVLIPTLTTNLFSLLLALARGEVPTSFGAVLRRLTSVNSWVQILLILYAVFWLIHGLRELSLRHRGLSALSFLGRKLCGVSIADWSICAVTLALSLITRLTAFKVFALWTFQPLGFAYGILFYYASPYLYKALRTKWLPALFAGGAFTAFFGLCYFKFRAVPFVGDWLLHLLVHLGVVATVIVLNRRVSFHSPVTRALGTVSFEMYLVHGTVYKALSVLIPGASPGVFLWVAIPSVFLCAAMLHFFNSRLLRGFKRLTSR